MIMEIFFDIDDTLFPSSEFSALARKNAINAIISMGLKNDYDSLYNKLLQIIEEKGSNYGMHFDDLLEDSDNPPRYIAAAVAAYHDTKASIAPYPDVPLTLLELKKEHGIHIATNGNSIKQWDKLIRLGISLYFDQVFISEDLGVQKSPDFFARALKTLGSKPERCIMVGDREDKDILPAKEAGLITIKVRKGRFRDDESCADYEIHEISEIPAIVKNL